MSRLINVNIILTDTIPHCLDTAIPFTDGIFLTGVYAVPSKSQNSTVLGQGGPSIGTIRHHIAKSQTNGFIEKMEAKT